MRASVRRQSDRRGLDAQPAQQSACARTAGLEPDLVQAQHVGLAVASRGVADFAERIHQGLKLRRKLGKYTPEHLPAPAAQSSSKRAVGVTAHGDVIVDVDELACKAVRKES